MEKFDLIVIGGGPAGYAAAMRGIDFQKNVCLIEKDKVGGAGVYNGALSSKTLWEISNKVSNINDTIVSEGRSPFYLSWNEVRKTLAEAIFERKFQYSCHIKLLQTETMNKLLHYERGIASMVSANEVKIIHEGEEKIIWGENIVLAAGSRPRKTADIPVDEKIIMTSDGIDQLEDYPKSLVIVGAGVIGCEYATIFSNFGKTKVYIIDRQDHILPFEDLDISFKLSSILSRSSPESIDISQLIKVSEPVPAFKVVGVAKLICFEINISNSSCFSSVVSPK
jgi:dihydrolipoamide dehydrogenase